MSSASSHKKSNGCCGNDNGSPTAGLANSFMSSGRDGCCGNDKNINRDGTSRGNGKLYNDAGNQAKQVLCDAANRIRTTQETFAKHPGATFDQAIGGELPSSISSTRCITVGINDLESYAAALSVAQLVKQDGFDQVNICGVDAGERPRECSMSDETRSEDGDESAAADGTGSEDGNGSSDLLAQVASKDGRAEAGRANAKKKSDPRRAGTKQGAALKNFFSIGDDYRTRSVRSMLRRIRMNIRHKFREKMMRGTPVAEPGTVRPPSRRERRGREGPSGQRRPRGWVQQKARAPRRSKVTT
jgi:hypothetical protein